MSSWAENVAADIKAKRIQQEKGIEGYRERMRNMGNREVFSEVFCITAEYNE